MSPTPRSRATVAELGLKFIPLTWESYDVVLAGSALGAARPLITAPTVQAAIDAIGGYDLTAAGILYPVDDPADTTDD